MKSSHTYPHSETEKVSAEPADVDISKLDPTKNPSNRLPSSSTNSNSTQQKMNLPENSARQLRSDPSMNSSIPPNASDPMLQMMQAMGLELPNPGGMPSDQMFGTEGGMPNPMMQQAFAGLSGMQMGNQPGREKTWVDQIFPLLNLFTVISLVVSAVLWCNPLSSYWRLLQGSGSTHQDLKVNLKAEWDALYPSGSTPAVCQALGPAQVFWMFVTIELTLQATKWMFNWCSAPPPGLLNTLINLLPRPYSSYIDCYEILYDHQ
ncbi:hypothetical protein MJO29_007373 [Puccinia striiformis f. sp. tritici]|nr:hypothetical protein Pst134EA_013546 [Puccinia striiformis f. sp. tritici]KAH9465663.1 hypothetical protein Pst134EA_013546 [Puccinia striiformis f. sp. tritici]KAI7955974.1 hypothetical protein MJO29_007373 [Puccinia striiformis f. sp. tritici]